MQTYVKTKQLYKVLIRVSKAESAYLYFTLEANEGIAFYSTLNSSIGQEYRDISAHCPLELQPQLDQILTSLRSQIDLQIIESAVINDDGNSQLL